MATTGDHLATAEQALRAADGHANSHPHSPDYEAAQAHAAIAVGHATVALAGVVADLSDHLRGARR